MSQTVTQTSKPANKKENKKNKKKKPTAIIVGLDGTLSDNRHRYHLIDPPQADWDGYHRLMAEDPVNVHCIEAINEAHAAGHKVYILTSRPDTYLEPTRQWLNENKVHYDTLIMRDPEDERTEDRIKKDAYVELIEPHAIPLFAIDNKLVTISMWHNLDLDTYWVRQGSLIKLNC